jgi:hypothetical protein
MKPHNPTSPNLVSFAGARPLALTKRQAITALGSSKLVARMLWASRYAADPSHYRAVGPRPSHRHHIGRDRL